MGDGKSREHRRSCSQARLRKKSYSSTVIERLINDNHKEYTTVIEVETLQGSFLQDADDNIIFLPVEFGMIDTINHFRQNNTPHLVILNIGAHWISILLNGDQTIVTDSLNNNQTTNPLVELVRYLFTEQEMPDAATFYALHTQLRDHHVDTESQEVHTVHARKVTKQSKRQSKGNQRQATRQAPPHDPGSDSDSNDEKEDKHQITISSEQEAKHIFRNKEGHLKKDTLENRKLLVELVNNKKNLLGPDKHGNQWYEKILKNGTQIWAQVWKNRIKMLELIKPPINITL